MAGIIQLLCIAQVASHSCEYAQIAMTESMCDLMRMKEWVRNEWRAKTWMKRVIEKSGKE